VEAVFLVAALKLSGRAKVRRRAVEIRDVRGCIGAGGSNRKERFNREEYQKQVGGKG
jgi:hypothetical protein